MKARYWCACSVARCRSPSKAAKGRCGGLGSGGERDDQRCLVAIARVISPREIRLQEIRMHRGQVSWDHGSCMTNTHENEESTAHEQSEYAQAEYTAASASGNPSTGEMQLADRGACAAWPVCRPSSRTSPKSSTASFDSKELSWSRLDAGNCRAGRGEHDRVGRTCRDGRLRGPRRTGSAPRQT